MRRTLMIALLCLIVAGCGSAVSRPPIEPDLPPVEEPAPPGGEDAEAPLFPPAPEPEEPKPAEPEPSGPAPQEPPPQEGPAELIAPSPDWAGSGAPPLPAIDPLLPEPFDVPEVWRHLDTKVRSVAAAFPGRLSVVALDLRAGARYEFRPNDRYFPASTFKLPVTLCVAEAIERGELAWDSLITFTPPDNDSVGQGGFATAPYGSRWTVRNLLDRSLIHSNNVAVKMLARTLTWEGLRRCTEQMGGPVTRTPTGSTAVSARDEAAWWSALWQMKQKRPELAENLLRPLRQSAYRGRIQSGTPRPDLVTHKFGTWSPYEHDGAIVWGGRPYVLVVLTYGGTEYQANVAIEQIARAAWDSIYSQ